MTDSPALERVSLRYSGRVQGVGFRVTAVDISRQYEVVGQVRNMLDGTVELLAEGAPDTLRAFDAALRQRMSRHIVDVRQAWSPISQASFHSFSIAESEPI